MTEIERELTTAQRRAARRREQAEAADAERDEVIRRALAAGVPRRRVVELTGFSPQRVDQIRRRSRL